MPKFFNNDLAELTHQLTLLPRRLRMEQIRGIDRLLGLVDASKAYPYEFVCFHITGYRKRGPVTDASIPGTALINDLVSMAEVVSRKAGITTAELGEAFLTHQEVSDELDVSTKTVRRWRANGLLGIRAVFEDGVNRLAFCRSMVDRFVNQNGELVQRASSFKQLSEKERDRIVDRARELVSAKPMKLHAAARQIAEEFGRTVETVRYTLRRYEESCEGAPLFSGCGACGRSERDQAIWDCHESGESAAEIAAAFDCPVNEIEQILAQIQVEQWAESPIECIHNELFDAPNADELILGVPEPEANTEKMPRVPSGLPAYLQSLYLTPLLTFEQEQDLFRRYNYLKHKAAKRLEGVDTESAKPADVAGVCELLQHAEGIKDRIIQANLRLVVSIAKKHVGWSPEFYEVISDGNMSLMRAVEKFNYALGNKFSTYASWAIMKNYARSIPEERYHVRRYVTGQDEMLAAAEARESAETLQSDKQQMRKLIEDGLQHLSDREQDVLRGHFGLEKDGKPKTLEQLGDRFGVTKERIRQIEKKALTRLKEVMAPSVVDVLG